MRHRWAAGAAAAAMVLAGAVTGCTGQGSSTGGSLRSPGAHTQETTSATSLVDRRRERRAAIRAAHRRAEATADDCIGTRLRLRLRGVGAGAGTYYQSFSLRNVGNRPCVVEALKVSYADARLRRVGFASASPDRMLDEMIARIVPRRALLAGETVYLRAGTVNTGSFGAGCGATRADNEILVINTSRFVWPVPNALVCTTKNGRPFIVWGSPRPGRGALPDGLRQPHLV